MWRGGQQDDVERLEGAQWHGGQNNIAFSFDSALVA
jgi:hypothetical protein